VATGKTAPPPLLHHFGAMELRPAHLYVAWETKECPASNDACRKCGAQISFLPELLHGIGLFEVFP
jgi:hypothetical protein